MATLCCSPPESSLGKWWDLSKILTASRIFLAFFLALAKLLTKAKSFKEALELTTHGDSTKVDMLVRDIYGYVYKQYTFLKN